MPIIKHISIHSTPLSSIEYILNGEKNDEMKFATGLNCSVNPQSAYDEFRSLMNLSRLNTMKRNSRNIWRTLKKSCRLNGRGGKNIKIIKTERNGNYENF